MPDCLDHSFHAADAGVQLALSRLAQSPPNLNAFDIDLPEGANMQSRSRVEAVPRDLSQVGLGATPEGYALNVGTGVGALQRVYVVNVTSSFRDSTTELEAKLARIEVEATGY